MEDPPQYLITEMANNVRQHSRGVGFPWAQDLADEEIIEQAMAVSLF